jgi:ABC-type uncharacterized transport system auxiliary subunit
MKTPLCSTLFGTLRSKSLRRSTTDLIWRFAASSGIAALAFGLAACGAAKPAKYYQVTYPTKSFVADDALNVTLVVRPIEASPLYLDDKIVYGFDNPEMGTYEYQRWSQPPAEILQMALVRGLRATGRFRSVYSLRADPSERFILTGNLYDFKEVDGNTIVARLNYEVRLLDRKTGAVLWTHAYTHDEPAAQKSVMSFVEAMDKNVQRSIQEIAASLEQYFRASPPQ